MEGGLAVLARFVEDEEGFIFGGGGEGEIAEVGLFGARKLLFK
jgi:hypothetical protein